MGRHVATDADLRLRLVASAPMDSHLRQAEPHDSGTSTKQELNSFHLGDRRKPTVRANEPFPRDSEDRPPMPTTPTVVGSDEAIPVDARFTFYLWGRSTRVRSRRKINRASAGTLIFLPRVKIWVRTPPPAPEAAPIAAPLPPPKIAPTRAPSPAPPPANSAVCRFAATPFRLLMSTSDVTTRCSLPFIVTENRSKTSSGLWTSPPLVISRTSSLAGDPRGIATIPLLSVTSSPMVAG